MWIHGNGHRLGLPNLALSCLLHTLHQVYGLPSVMFLYKQKVATFKACTGSFSTEILKANIDNMIVPRTECCLWVLMWDEVATEQRMQWNAADSLFYGLCREHGHRVSLEFHALEDVEAVH